MSRYVVKYRIQKKRLENVEDQINELMNMTTDSLGMSLRDKIEGIQYKRNDMFKDNKSEEVEIERLKELAEKLDNERKALDKERKEIIQKNNFYSKEIEVLRAELSRKQADAKVDSVDIEKVENQYLWHNKI